MHLVKLFGAALAVAMLSALPAHAAVSPHNDLTAPFSLMAPTDEAAGVVCQAGFNIEATILFVHATNGCDAVLADATGLCLAPVPGGTSIVSAMLAPDVSMICTATRPSPPG